MKIGDRVKVRWFTIDAGGIDIPGTVVCDPSLSTPAMVDIRLDQPLYNSLGMSKTRVIVDVRQVTLEENGNGNGNGN